MPTFDYVCTSCGECFEVFLLPRELDTSEIVCQYCGAKEVRRAISAPRVVYKGDGYYATTVEQSAELSSEGGTCGGGCSCH